MLVFASWDWASREPSLVRGAVRPKWLIESTATTIGRILIVMVL
jgi:hypothetical protein